MEEQTIYLSQEKIDELVRPIIVGVCYLGALYGKKVKGYKVFSGAKWQTTWNNFGGIILEED